MTVNVHGEYEADKHSMEIDAAIDEPPYAVFTSERGENKENGFSF